MKRKISLIAVLVILVAVVAVGSLAYFTASETATNKITTGSIKIELNDKLNTGEEIVDFEEQTGVMPGSIVPKEVSVTNSGSNDAWIRISLISAINEDEIDLSEHFVSLNIDPAKWELKDGYYYYKQPLASGATTDLLFSEIKFDLNMDPEYQEQTFSINVKAEAVQVANNGATVMEAAGWPK